MGFKWLEKELGRALKAAGNKDQYQYIVIGLLCVIFFINIFLIVGPSIYFMDPVFQCGQSKKSFDQSQACGRMAQCQITNDYTIVAKMKLYCSRQYERSIIQSSLSIGSLCGLIFMNIISDLKGRKFALMIDLFVAVLSSFLTFVGSELEITHILVFASILSGFSGYSLIIISYIMLGDICQESLRQKSSVYINSCLSLGLCSFFFIYTWCNEWYNIVILFMLVPLLAVTIASYYIIEESPNFYIFQNYDSAACTESLIRIAKVNNKKYSDIERIKYHINKIKMKMSNKHKDYGQDTQSNVLKSLSKWKYLKVIICMAIVEGGGNMSFYVIAYAVNDIGYSFGIMNLAIGIVQIITTLAVAQYVTTLERKKTLAIFYGVTPFLSAFFMLDFVASSPFLSTILILSMRVMTTTGYFMIVMIQTQSFPLEIQSIGAGSIQAFSQIGSIIAPLLNAFSINHKLPRVSTMGVMMLICLIPLVFVPETSSSSYQKQIESKHTNREIKSEVISVRQ